MSNFTKLMQQAASGVGGGGDFYPYTIENSARFNDNDSAYLYRTPSTAGNRKTWTWSGWVKRGNLDTYQSIVPYTESGAEWFGLFWDANNSLVYDVCWTTGTNRIIKQTPALFRDTSSWYHITLVVDTTQAVGDDRIKLYVNGSQVLFTTYVTGSGSVPQNQNLYTNTTTVHYIGRRVSSDRYLDGYLSEVNFIDGQALDPTSFGENKNGVWIPKAYSGSYGTNGFYLDFADSSALGNDVSGNNNDFTSSGLAANDQMIDTPTNSFATFNPLKITTGSLGAFVLSDGNKTLSRGSGNPQWVQQPTSMVLPSTGAYYWEYVHDAGTAKYADVGLTKAAADINMPSATNQQIPGYNTELQNRGFGYRLDTRATMDSTSGSYVAGSTLPTTPALGDVIGIAMDMDAGTMKVYIEGVLETTFTPNTFDPAEGWVPTVAHYTTSDVGTINFGQEDFGFTPPAGYLALSTANFPEPTIGPNSATLSDEHFNTVLYTGTGSSQSITGVGFQPDFLWIKRRSAAEYHWIVDVLRTLPTGFYPPALPERSDLTDAVTSFDSDGFTAGSGSGYTGGSGSTYVAWNWKAGGSGVSNTDGSITSTVSANQDAGISIVRYAGTGASMTFGHGLGQPVDFMIVHRGGDNWIVYPFSATGNLTNFLQMENTSAYLSDSVCHTNNSTVIGFNASGARNTSGFNYMAYCFAEVEGFSSFGSYTGNGSADGPMIYTGFRPAWFMLKKSSGTGWWYIFDSERNTYNLTGKAVFPNSTSAESDYPGGSSLGMDFLSNGVKLRGYQTEQNGSGTSYIYIAFAENPFKYSNAR